MTIDEAIARERQQAKEQRSHIGTWDEEYSKKCEECAEEHEQLAEWLEELKAYKSDEFTSGLQKLAYHQGYSKAESDYFENTQIDRESSYKIGHEIGYNKAIDDFAEKIVINSNRLNVDTDDFEEFGDNVANVIYGLAEQLKAGGENV